MYPVKLFMIPVEQFVTVDSDVTVSHAVQVMRDHGIGSVFVSRNGNILGNLSDTEVAWRLIALGMDPGQTTVESIMSSPIHLLDENQTLQDANDLMAREHIRHLGISQGGKLVGMVSVRDVLVGMTTGPSSVLPPTWVCYQEGVRAYEQKDYTTALKQFGLLAEQGMARAQYNLGAMYQQGQGVLQDDVQALMWTILAAVKGIEAAVDIQKSLIKDMSSDQIMKAERLAKEWKPKEN